VARISFHPARFLAILALAAAASAPSRAQQPPPAGRTYEPGTDSLPQDGVPKGRLDGPMVFRSTVIPGTVRKYWVYVPAQYSPERPANLLVFQDGQRATNPDGPLRVPQVLENLIHKKDIPPTIGLFITPGHRADAYPEDLGLRNPNNRAAEYDSLTDAYARFRSMSSCRRWERSTGSRPTRRDAPLAGRAAAPSAPSPSRGTARISSAT
jgi:enterochelin esterase family protein